MKKPDLLKFIELYNLSGTVEKVKIESDGTDLKTVFITEDKTLYGTITYKGLGLEKGEYGIHDTAQFKKMLGVLDDDITATVNRLDDNRPVSLTFNDKNADSTIMLADLSVIPKTPKGVQPGTTDFEFTIDADFVNRYIRSKNALTDVSSFTLLFNPKSKKTELVIGYSNISTNRIRLDINPVPGKDKITNQVSFNADYLKEILSKNSAAGSTMFKVNSAGLAHLIFKTDAYEANYYLLKVTSI